MLDCHISSMVNVYLLDLVWLYTATVTSDGPIMNVMC